MMEPNSHMMIQKYIDYDLLFYLYHNKFQHWDFYILNYLFSFKQCRLVMDRLLSKNKTIKKIVTKNITLQISDTIDAAEDAASARKLIILL